MFPYMCEHLIILIHLFNLNTPVWEDSAFYREGTEEQRNQGPDPERKVGTKLHWVLGT